MDFTYFSTSFVKFLAGMQQGLTDSMGMKKEKS
jgi:hypothetical protein